MKKVQVKSKKNKKIQFVSRERSLAFVNPELSKEWNYKTNYPLTPQNVFANSRKIVSWRCLKCGNKYKGAIRERNRGNKVCLYCRSLGYLFPRLSKEWHSTKNGKLTPYKVPSKSNKKVWWECKKGHEWESTISSRSNGRGCRYCNQVVLKGNIVCASIIEAYYYLKYKQEGKKFIHNKKYVGFGAHRYDFYLLNENKYIEVTSYNQKWKYWSEYYANIKNKQKYVENKLKAKFEFIQLTLTSRQIRFVRQYVI